MVKEASVDGLPLFIFYSIIILGCLSIEKESKVYELTKKERLAVEEYLVAKGLPTHIDVTFGDVTLPEHYSSVRSRSEIDDFGVVLAEGVELGIPIIGANMESVTGIEMAVALGREGGIAFVPQTLPIEERLAIIEKIRRTDCAFIEKPLTIRPQRTLRQAKNLMNRFGIFSLVVVDEKNRPIAILSTRDWRYEADENKLVKDLVRYATLVKAQADISFNDAAALLRKHRIEKLPLVDKSGKLCGLITAHGLFYKMRHPRATRDEKGRFLVAGSIGVGRKFTAAHLREAEEQVKRGICLLLIDTARAFSENTEEAMRQIKRNFPRLPLVAGNVSTPEGAKFLFECGADCVKVNQGRGYVCRTSEIGVGIPQLSAIAKCAAIARRYGKTIIGDGGMKSPGDMIKAIAAGADALMTGYLLVGTRESAAQMYLNKDGLPVKNYEGSASFQAQVRRMAQGTLDRIRRPEGVTEEIPVTGTVEEKIRDILDAFRSAMSYCGVRSLKEFREKAVFGLQTRAGLYEGIKK